MNKIEPSTLGIKSNFENIQKNICWNTEDAQIDWKVMMAFWYLRSWLLLFIFLKIWLCLENINSNCPLRLRWMFHFFRATTEHVYCNWTWRQKRRYWDCWQWNSDHMASCLGGWGSVSCRFRPIGDQYHFDWPITGR